MKWAYGFTTLVALALSPLVLAAAEQPGIAAQASVVAWLKLVDSADYGGSWDTAASLFRHTVTKAQWASAAAAARAPLGDLMSRKLRTSKFTKSLPGAPDGEYVVVTFETRFKNKAAAIETVTPTRDVDGRWRVSGYYIR